jgi:hypothetical protein
MPLRLEQGDFKLAPHLFAVIMALILERDVTSLLPCGTAAL